MFKSLQARLTISYILIIVVCLALVGLSALLLLRGYQRTLMYNRLRDRATLASSFTAQMLSRGDMPQEVVNQLTQQLNRGTGALTLIYLLEPSGRATAGGDNGVDQRALQRLATKLTLASDLSARGEMRLADGRRLLYVVERVRGSASEGPEAAAQLLVFGEVYRPVRLVLGDLFPRLLWAGAIALAVSVILAAMMAFSIARPLERIAQAAEAVASGDYQQQVQIAAPTEVARLAASFNSMAEQIQATLQSQADLVANVSHELKTPLTSIQGFSQALLDGVASDPEAQERAAAVIHEEAGRMRRLVDELLELAKLEAGEIGLAQEPVEVLALLEACAARFTPQAKQAGTTLLLELPPSLPPILGDSDHLGRVFDNLLDNALKHTRDVPEGGRVILHADWQGGNLICSVTDNGPGIPAADLSRIFERFYQVDKSRVRRGSGAGLGLSIAQEIVAKHGGCIGAESVEGLGTRITVELPVEQT